MVEEALPPWLLGTAPIPPSLAARREENDKLRAALAGEQVLLHGLFAKPELNQRIAKDGLDGDCRRLGQCAVQYSYR